MQNSFNEWGESTPDAFDLDFSVSEPEISGTREDILYLMRSLGPSVFLIAQELGVSVHEAKNKIVSDIILSREYSEWVKRIISVARTEDGHKAEIAKSFGTTRSTLQRWIDENPALQEAFEDIEEEGIDDAVRVVKNAMKEKKQWATELLLRTSRGRNRGFGEPKDRSLVDKLSEFGIVAADVRIQIRDRVIKPALSETLSIEQKQIGDDGK